MGHNVQSQAGQSLTGIYDVRGGQAPVERIETSVVQAVHDMASTVASERFSQGVRKIEHLAGGQSTNFNITISDLPSGPWKIDAIVVSVSSDPSRLTKCAVGLRSNSQRDMPLWVWDDTNSRLIFMEIDAAANGVIVLTPDPAYTQLPQLASGRGQPQRMDDMFLTGTLGAFGAGTEDIFAWIKISSFDIGRGVSPVGLPIPSW